MEIKIVVLLLLILCLFINFLQEKDTFNNLKGGHIHIRNVVEEEVDKMLGDSALKHGSTDKTTDHKTLTSLTAEIKKTERGIEKTHDKTHKVSLATDKVLLTLFYDPLDKHSADFYDDSMVSESEIATGSFSSPSASTNLDMDEVIKISSMEMKPWNKLKKMLNSLQNIPYASRNFLYLEEVKCSVKRIDEAHLNDSILVKRQYNSDDYQTHTLGKQTLSEQPPRGKLLVDKLPKVIFSFLKPNGTDKDDNEIKTLHQIEYEGLYSMFQDRNPISVYNMIKYMKETVDKHLETKEIDLDTPGESKDVLRMIYHYKTHHPTKTLDKDNIAIEKGKIISKENDSKFILLNQERLLMPPFFNNSFIYKCRHCPVFITTSNKLQ